MAICKQLLDLMGETISFESRQGKGTTFVVELPCRIDLSVPVKKKEPGKYDLILMDIMMPVMAANAFPDDIAEAKRAGMNEHLAKPVDGNRMLEVIQEYVR